MTFLVGQQGTGWTIVSNNDVNASGNASYFAPGYTAAASGSMSTAQFYVPSTAGQGGATRMIVYVYSGGGVGATLVAQSSPIAINGSTGLNSAAISGNISSGQTYTLVVVPTNTAGTQTGFPNAAGNSGAAMTTVNQNTVANFPSGSPPSSIPTADLTNSEHEFIVWIDGTVSSNTFTSETVSSTVGNLGSNPNYQVTSQSVTSVEGTATLSSQVTLGSQTITSTEGVINNGSFLAPSLTGTFSEGVLTPTIGNNVTIALGSNSAQFLQGSPLDQLIYILDSGSQNIAVLGQSLLSAQGAIAALPSPLLGAQSVASSEGVLADVVLPTIVGELITSAEGTIIIGASGNVTTSLGPMFVSSAEGILVDTSSMGLSAESISSSNGTITFFTSSGIILPTSQINATLGGITVSAGALMPSVVGMSFTDATTAILNAGGVISAAEKEDSVYPQEPRPFGTILTQYPAPGIGISVQTPIFLVISSGLMSIPGVGTSIENDPNIIVSPIVPPG